jgi:hypothetical protein
MMDARTLGSIALLVASVAAAGLPRAAEAATCDALIGKWAWFTGGVVSKRKVAEGPPIECVGDACRDLDYGPEQIAACHLVNQGCREIAVGIVKSGSREPSISAPVAPGRAVRLTHIMGCLSAKEIGRIEARYEGVQGGAT